MHLLQELFAIDIREISAANLLHLPRSVHSRDGDSGAIENNKSSHLPQGARPPC